MLFDESDVFVCGFHLSEDSAWKAYQKGEDDLSHIVDFAFDLQKYGKSTNQPKILADSFLLSSIIY